MLFQHPENCVKVREKMMKTKDFRFVNPQVWALFVVMYGTPRPKGWSSGSPGGNITLARWNMDLYGDQENIVPYSEVKKILKAPFMAAQAKVTRIMDIVEQSMVKEEKHKRAHPHIGAALDVIKHNALVQGVKHITSKSTDLAKGAVGKVANATGLSGSGNDNGREVGRIQRGPNSLLQSEMAQFLLLRVLLKEGVRVDRQLEASVGFIASFTFLIQRLIHLSDSSPQSLSGSLMRLTSRTFSEAQRAAG
jgi:hypothetical protein